MSHECEYCENTLSSKQALEKHKINTKKCIEIQKKLGEEGKRRVQISFLKNKEINATIDQLKEDFNISLAQLKTEHKKQIDELKVDFNTEHKKLTNNLKMKLRILL